MQYLHKMGDVNDKTLPQAVSNLLTKESNMVDTTYEYSYNSDMEKNPHHLKTLLTKLRDAVEKYAATLGTSFPADVFKEVDSLIENDS